MFRPDGTRLAGPFFFGTTGKAVALQLPSTGTYSALLDPQGPATGSVTASLGKSPSRDGAPAPRASAVLHVSSLTASEIDRESLTPADSSPAKRCGN